MRNVVLFAVVVLLVALPTCAAAQRTRSRPAGQTTQRPSRAQASQEQQDREEIQKLHDRDIQASMALDVDQLSSLWDDEVVVIPPGGRPIQGRAAVRAWMEKNAEAMRNVEILGYNEDWDEVRIFGEYAYERGTIRERHRPYAGGEEQESMSNVMRILKREADGSWRVYRTIWNEQALPVTEQPSRAVEPVNPKPKPEEPPK